ncbi:hypothetical protein Bbad01_21480 [Bacillus badius]|nr:hypothetical protein Bbad01_21480 [Bacillus badius]
MWPGVFSPQNTSEKAVMEGTFRSMTAFLVCMLFFISDQNQLAFIQFFFIRFRFLLGKAERFHFAAQLIAS